MSKVIRIELLETRQVVHYVEVQDDADIYRLENDFNNMVVNTEGFHRNSDDTWKTTIEASEEKDFEMDLEEFANDYFK